MKRGSSATPPTGWHARFRLEAIQTHRFSVPGSHFRTLVRSRMPYRYHRWRDALQLAPNDRAIVGVINDYVTTLDPEAIKALPGECREALFDRDIARAAVTLLRSELVFDGPPEVANMLHEIAHVFAAASVRLSRLGSEFSQGQ